MKRRLQQTRLILLVATLAVLGGGALIVRSFLLYAFVPCAGALEPVSPADVIGDGPRDDVPSDEIDIRYTATPPSRWGRAWKYTDVHAALVVAEGSCACADVDVPMPFAVRSTTPDRLRVFRDRGTGIYVVTESPSGPWVATFRKAPDASGRRWQPSRVVDAHNVSLLVLLASLGALAVAAARAIRATPYATRMHGWTSATLRPDGLVEGEGGALGVMGARARARVPAGTVLVDPAAIQGRGAYREMPVLTRRSVGAGGHARWLEGTSRLLRDARALAVVSTLTTALALVAHVIAGG